MAKRARMEVSDGIDLLPDELLVFILCFLSLKEAVATSILCRRWRYLWTFANKLDFNGLDFFRRVGSKLKHFECFSLELLFEIWSVMKNLDESWSYIAWVNNILEFHEGCIIEEFRVDFILYEAHEKHIDRWLRFTSAKKIKRLELNLRWTSSRDDVLYLGYSFPCINFEHLRTIRLQCLNISNESLQFLVGNSPLLEELSLSYIKRLTTFKMIGPSLALKRIEINSCYLFSIEIHDVNLEFLMYHGTKLECFVIKNVPLVEMHLGGEMLNPMEDFLWMFSSYLPSLEKLTIDAFYMHSSDEEEYRMFYNNVTMSNLYQLKIKCYRVGNYMPLVTFFIRATPSLQSFVLEVYGGSNIEESFHFLDSDSLPERMDRYRYPDLKQVKFIGYRGTPSELGLIVHLLENGSALKQLIIDLRKRDNKQLLNNYFWPNSVNGPLVVGYPCVEEHEINAIKAKVRKQLMKIVPSELQKQLHINVV